MPFSAQKLIIQKNLNGVTFPASLHASTLMLQESMKRHFYLFSDFATLEAKYPKTCACKTTPRDNQGFIDQYRDDLLNGKKVSAEKIAQSIFPLNKGYDVFISHRSTDFGRAHALKKRIEKTTSLRCFIDGDIWQDMYAIVEPYQKALIKRGGELRDANRLMAQFALLLQDSLVCMMKLCPNFLFVAPPEMASAARKGRIETDSPWINLELQEAKKLYTNQQLQQKMLYETTTVNFSITYNPSVMFLRRISYNKLSLMGKE